MKGKKVYIASPYTKGDVACNVARAMKVYNAVMNEGFYPFMPLLTHFQHMAHPRTYDYWMEYDLEWLKSCDYLIRLAGTSKGADIEVKFAMENNIPVYLGLNDFLDHVVL